MYVLNFYWSAQGGDRQVYKLLTTLLWSYTVCTQLGAGNKNLKHTLFTRKALNNNDENSK